MLRNINYIYIFNATQKVKVTVFDLTLAAPVYRDLGCLCLCGRNAWCQNFCTGLITSPTDSKTTALHYLTSNNQQLNVVFVCVCVGGGCTVLMLSVCDILVFQYLEKALTEFHKIWQTH